MKKTILVTGASKGIGRAIVLRFSEQGTNVVIHYNSSEKEALSLEKEVKKLGAKTLLVKADVSSSKQVLQMINKTIDAFGSIDVLVNNAGIYEAHQFKDMNEEVWDRTIDVNLKGVFNCVKAVYPYMKKSGSGKIINISSAAAFTGSLSNAAYGVSKAGIVNFTKTLSKELGPYGITINSIAPGLVSTPSLVNNVDSAILKKLNKETPLGRIASPKDIANVVSFFSSNDSDFITGQTLVVDGGRF